MKELMLAVTRFVFEAIVGVVMTAVLLLLFVLYGLWLTTQSTEDENIPHH